MALPDTRRGLEDLGYRYDGEGHCRGCGALILWYATPNINPKTGKNNKMPMSIVAGTENAENRSLEPHWVVCPDRDKFRRPKEKKK